MEGGTVGGRAGKALAVEWYFSRWEVAIGAGEALVPPSRMRDGTPNGAGTTIKPLIRAGLMGHAARFQKPDKTKFMKKNLLNKWPGRLAFTLVELLVVIAIIAILASMILTALAGAKRAALKVKAKTEMADIVNAITAYEADYSRFPVTTNEQNYANSTTSGDFTTGLIFGPGVNGNNTGYSYDNNSNVMAILMDMENYPNGTHTVNLGHVKNPRQTKYLNAKPSGYTPTQAVPVRGDAPGGVDNTGVYRDPWGNPYVITMDLNYDDKCSDILYSLQAVSQNGANSQAGFYGLSNTNVNGNTDNFLYNGRVMVWSAGPDTTYTNGPAINAPNKDNVLSWQ